MKQLSYPCSGGSRSGGTRISILEMKQPISTSGNGPSGKAAKETGCVPHEFSSACLQAT